MDVNYLLQGLQDVSGQLLPVLERLNAPRVQEVVAHDLDELGEVVPVPTCSRFFSYPSLPQL